MNGGRVQFRSWWKATVLVIALLRCVASYGVLRLRSKPVAAQRVHWLHRSCKLVLRRLGFGLSLSGSLPQSGLLVSNHLSYLDILFYGAAMPCAFVAKTEVRSWPLLGLLASLGGTIFVDRRSATSTARAAARIQDMLESGILVLVFPEGTSSNGGGVLRFFPSLFEPAVRAAAPVSCAAIRYSGGADTREGDLCYYGEVSFVPHLLQTLQLSSLSADLRFASPAVVYTGRKQAAKETHERVVELRAARMPPVGHAADRPEAIDRRLLQGVRV